VSIYLQPRQPPGILTSSHRYQKNQTIHGLPQAAGLSHCQKLPEPIYTPSTKAEVGEKDVNISPAQAREIVGEKYAKRIEELALACYKTGATYAEERGILIVSFPSCRDFPDVRFIRSQVVGIPQFRDNVWSPCKETADKPRRLIPSSSLP
jgi:hypothetical protein